MNKEIKKYTIFVCQETPCLSMGSDLVFEALKKEAARQKADNVDIEISGCHGHGLCEQGPSVVVEPDGVFYIRVQPEDAAAIIGEHILKGNFINRLLYINPKTGAAIPYRSEVDFLRKQQRIILRNCGHINPEKIEHYMERGGYAAFNKALLHMSPEQVIEEVTGSGLRGRGGAGFPTGKKWEFCRKEPADQKYMICNADEGDPGAFMDRSILEADPHSVIEGLAIAGYAIGATRGYIYVRAEYPLAVKRVRIAIEQAKSKGFLGKNILGSGFDFELEIKEGRGALFRGDQAVGLHEVVSGKVHGRPSDDAITLFESQGIGIEDVAGGA